MPEDPCRWSIALATIEDGRPYGAWGRFKGGVPASRKEVDYNRKRLPGAWYIPRVSDVAMSAGLPAGILLGLFDRESNHGRSLREGYGDGGNGFGVGQVDGRHHTQLGKPDPYSVSHMTQAAGIFKRYLQDVEKKHPDWLDKYVLKGAFVAYNSGLKNVQTVGGMDRGTTGDDYGADTMARARYWQELLG